MSDKHHYEHPKIELLPPELVLLRKELYTNWPTLWSIVAGMLVHDHEHLLEYMNAATDSNVDPCKQTLAEGCLIWLRKLERLRYSASTGIHLPNGNILNS